MRETEPMSQVPRWVKVVVAIVVGVAVGWLLNATVGPLQSPWNWVLLGVLAVAAVLTQIRDRARRKHPDRVS